MRHPPVSLRAQGNRSKWHKVRIEMMTDDRQIEPGNQQGFVKKQPLVNKDSPQRLNLILAKGRVQRIESQKAEDVCITLLGLLT